MRIFFIPLLVVVVLISACAARLPGTASGPSTTSAEAIKAPSATGAAAAVTQAAPVVLPVNKVVSSVGGVTASLVPLQGSKTSGTLRFVQKGSRVNVSGEVFGLTPGLHGLHIHETGDCSGSDGMAAKGHLNPGNKPHGGLAGERHVGDLGNINSDTSGIANLNIDLDGIALSTAANGIINRSVIVQSGPDDLKSQPEGNSGKRIACGIIAMK